MRDMSFCNNLLLLVIITDEGVRSMISIPGSLPFAKLVMMSSAPAKSEGVARYASQDPFIVPYNLDSKRNTPFPSCCESRYESEAKCKVFIHMQTKLIFI